MKKLLLVMLCLTALVMSGCGDKYAKEKEAMTKAEKTVLSLEVPVVVRPDYTKTQKPTKQDYEKYWADFQKLLDVEDKIVAETRKSDEQIAELLKKAESDSDKKSLKEFKEKLHQDRIAFVKKVSKGRLCGDTFIVGVGSTWQEVELVYGKPKDDGKERRGSKEYAYDGITFEDWIGGGAYPPNHPKLLNWKSIQVQAVFVTGKDCISDAGIKMGMTKDEVFKTLQSKFVKKFPFQKDTMNVGKGYSLREFDIIVQYSMQDTLPYNIFPNFKDGKLERYIVAPH